MRRVPCWEGSTENFSADFHDCWIAMETIRRMKEEGYNNSRKGESGSHCSLLAWVNTSRKLWVLWTFQADGAAAPSKLCSTFSTPVSSAFPELSHWPESHRYQITLQVCESAGSCGFAMPKGSDLPWHGAIRCSKATHKEWFTLSNSC